MGRREKRSGGDSGVKRLLDILLALVVAVLFSPILALTALLVFASLGSPVLFQQNRAGLEGRSFTLLKWRSMRNATDVHGRLLPDEQRVTRVGLIIRRFRIDELPSVINILRGELSFVGPRPLPPGNPINNAHDGARLALRPGLTGLAQVSGNTLLSEQEKLAIDLYYIRTRSFIRDVVIIWRTLLTVLQGEMRHEPTVRHALDMLEKHQ
jgi:lipopolysaccharide/colanic/teichoic acid biosynthesis glycosyltransferase